MSEDTEDRPPSPPRLRFGFRFEGLASLATVLSAVEPVYERLRSKGKVPESGRIVPLADSPKDGVRDLVVRNLGSVALRIAERIQPSVNSYSLCG